MDGSATTRVDYGSEEAAMQAYLRDGERRAAGLGNRGPIRFTAAGELHPDIVDAYWRCGFYVFQGVLKPDELADIERDVRDILDRVPVERGATLDAKGRPALAVGLSKTSPVRGVSPATRVTRRPLRRLSAYMARSAASMT